MLSEIYTAASTINKLANNPMVRDVCKATVDSIASNPLVLMRPWDLLVMIPDTYFHNKEHSEIMSGFDKVLEGLGDIKKQNQNILSVLGQVQTSLGALQITTAIIGVGTFAGVALVTANLWQTLKLREDIKQLRGEVKSGFDDIEKALRDQGSDIIKKIEEVAKDSAIQAHKLQLVKAYGLFLGAKQNIEIALQLQGKAKLEFLHLVQGMLADALAHYHNPLLYSETCAAGLLRRRECAWAIEQTRALTFHLQNQANAAMFFLRQLEKTIRQDLIQVAQRCKSEEELAFIFPEILRIYTQDLPALQMQMLPIEEQLGYLKQKLETLPPAEQKAYLKQALTTSSPSNSNSKQIVVAKPREQELYELLKEKTHYESLLHILKFIVDPHSRPRKEAYIERQAKATGYQGFIPSNWEDVPHLTVANLYHYFKLQKTASA